MKKIIIILVLLVNNTYSQTLILTKGLTFCVFDKKTEEWTNCESDFQQTSLLTIDEDNAIVTHTIYNNKSSYYILEKFYDKNSKDNMVISYKIIGNDNQKYELFVNFKELVIDVIYFNKNNIMEGLMLPITSINNKNQ